MDIKKQCWNDKKAKCYLPRSFDSDKAESNPLKPSDLNGLESSTVLFTTIPSTMVGIPLILGASGLKKCLKSCRDIEWILQGGSQINGSVSKINGLINLLY